jgi:signal transduction histidine kinase
MSIYFVYHYHVTKDKLYNSINHSININVSQLDNILSYYIDSYSVNEYENLITNQMQDKNIIAIILKDYNMAKIMGDDEFITGKVRDENWRVISYDINNNSHKTLIDQSYMSIKKDILDSSDQKLGTIELYTTDKFVNLELDAFIKQSIIEVFILTMVLIVILFVSVKSYLLNPLYDIIDNIKDIDEDGIPTNSIPNTGYKELRYLSDTMNSMIDVIKDSKDRLKRLNDDLEDRIESKIEELRKKEQLLIQQSKLATLGEMIGNIAHQWRQPLNALSLKKELMIDDYYEKLLTDAVIEKFDVEVDNLLQHMSKTIDDFRNFFIPSKEKVDFELIKSIGEILNIVNAQLDNHDIKLIIKNHYKSDITLNGYPNEFKQVIVNIITNAKDAIIKRQEQKEIIDGVVVIDLYKNDEQIKIDISDNGGGIPEDIIHRVFEPYFTTKFQTQGTGLGLYMSKTIIETNMKGALSVKNGDDGAVFSIVFG